VPLAYMYYRQYRRTRAHNAWALALWLLPAAQLGLMLYMYWLTGNPLAHVAMQSVWGNHLAFPLAALLQFLAQPLLIDYYGWNLTPFSLAFVLAALVLTIGMIKSAAIPREYLLYTLLSLGLIISRDTLEGSLRFLLPIFPLYLALALFLQKRTTLYNLTLFVLSALQLFYFVAFVHQYNWAAT